MEGYVGEIRLIAANFAPQSWQLCQGQSLQIRTNTALYAIIGTYYGGDGSQTFMLPNLAGRLVVGAGQGPGLSQYGVGQMGGTATVKLSLDQMPAHVHNIVLQQDVMGVASVACAADGGASASPDGAIIASDSNSAVYTSSKNIVAMSPQSVTSGNFSIPAPTITDVTPIGNDGAHNNLQPYLGLNYIICVNGYFPSRD